MGRKSRLFEHSLWSPDSRFDALQQMHIPFIFATGYGSTGLRKEYGNRPVLQKPFQAKDLEIALAQGLGGSNVDG
jgi:hypothetical protein